MTSAHCLVLWLTTMTGGVGVAPAGLAIESHAASKARSRTIRTLMESSPLDSGALRFGKCNAPYLPSRYDPGVEVGRTGVTVGRSIVTVATGAQVGAGGQGGTHKSCPA
jgi:hypothetical protein